MTLLTTQMKQKKIIFARLQQNGKADHANLCHMNLFNCTKEQTSPTGIHGDFKIRNNWNIHRQYATDWLVIVIPSNKLEEMR